MVFIIFGIRLVDVEYAEDIVDIVVDLGLFGAGGLDRLGRREDLGRLPDEALLLTSDDVEDVDIED